LQARIGTMKYYVNDNKFSIDLACFGQVEPMQISDLILYGVFRRLLSNLEKVICFVMH